MRVSDIPEVEEVASVAPEVVVAQVEVEVVLVAHPTTTTALDMGLPLTVLLTLPIQDLCSY